MEKKIEQFSADAYTLRAEVRLRRVEENECLQAAIREGNQEEYEAIMKNAVDYRLTWGDHIKRFIFDCISDGTLKIEDLTHEEVVAFIKKAFRDNGMNNRGSMNPKTKTTLESQLEGWLASPAVKISRQTCFLFCFGLNMDEEQTAYMLTDVLRQSEFIARDYKEAIYYYCLRNNLQYAGVVEWLEKYEKLPVSEQIREEKNDIRTRVLKKNLLTSAEQLAEDAFVQYLIQLKKISENKKKSQTSAEVLKANVNELSYSLSPKLCTYLDENLQKMQMEQYKTVFTSKQYQRRVLMLGKMMRMEASVNFEQLQKDLESVPTDHLQISDVFEQMVEEGVLSIPSFTAKSLEKKISERSSEIKREDILMAVFLVCACSMGNPATEEKGTTYQERKAEFFYEANQNLEKCGFSSVYLLNPFELFLVSCLLQERPMEYFLAVWKKYRGK